MNNGAAAMIAKLNALKKSLPQQVAKAAYQEMSIEATESMKRTPVDTGNLRASTRVIDPVIDGDHVSVSIVVGGVAAPYAVYVHENLDAHHETGQAKFLESTLLESRQFLAARITKRVSVKNNG